MSEQERQPENNPDNPKDDQHKGAHKVERKKSRPSKRKRLRMWLRKWQVVVELIVAVVLGLATIAVILWQAVIYRAQWIVMQDQFTLQQTALEQSRLAERAWMVVKAASLKEVVKAGEYAQSNLLFVNAGRTPANNVHLHWWTGVEVPGQRVSALPKTTLEGYDSQAVLPPLVDSPQHITTKVRLNEDTIKLVSAGRYQVYVYGTVSYDDVVGHHTTDFCFTSKDAATTTDYNTCIDGNVAK